MKDEIKKINLPKEIEEAFNCIDYELSVCNDELPKILDYITNLQEENETLKQPQIFIDTMDMEERYGQELYEDYLKEHLEDYKSRIDKAREMIRFIVYNSERPLTIAELNKVYNTLGGDNNE